MKFMLAVTLLVLSFSTAFATPPETIRVASADIEIDEAELAELKKTHHVVVEELDEAQLSQFYALAGVKMGKVDGGFIGIGVRDSRGVFSGELRWHYRGSDELNDVTGEEVNVYLKPFLLMNGQHPGMNNIVIGTGFTNFDQVEYNNQRGNLKHSSIFELGYDTPNWRLTGGLEDQTIQNPNYTTAKRKFTVIRFVLKMVPPR